MREIRVIQETLVVRVHRLRGRDGGQRGDGATGGDDRGAETCHSGKVGRWEGRKVGRM